eukprot:PhM_4_TR8700/c0_g2_i1/m.33266
MMSEIVSSPTAATVVVVGSFFVFYSGYDKSTGRLNLRKMLVPIFMPTTRKAVSVSLFEVNKVLGLAGLTLLSVSYVPLGDLSLLRPHALALLTAHGAYSSVKFWRRAMPRSGKSVSMWLGAATLLLAVSGESTTTVVSSGGVVCLLGTVHFYTMETDARGKLGVRPFGYVAMAAGVLVAAARFSTALFRMM